MRRIGIRMAVLVMGLTPVFAGEPGMTPCGRTALLARTACRSDVRDDYFTRLGRCENLGTAQERDDCRDEADEVRKEESAACQERLAARLDVCDHLDEVRYTPEIDPAGFVSPEAMAADPNPYFPLVPGYEWVYENEEEIITVTVTEETVELMGVTCVAVRDVVTLKTENGEPVEDTTDWYAQDLEGNLWYFGEIARNYEDGLLADLEGSWRAGEEGAQPGVLLFASPYPGLAYREEFLLREAEDVAEVLSVDASDPGAEAVCSSDCLETLNYTPLEPEVLEHKYYRAGIGLVLEVDPDSGERTELVGYNF